MIRRTSSFLLAQPSSRAGSSTPLRSASARNAPSGSWNSAKPKPCGLFAGVMRRLNDDIGPQAWINGRERRKKTRNAFGH